MSGQIVSAVVHELQDAGLAYALAKLIHFTTTLKGGWTEVHDVI